MAHIGENLASKGFVVVSIDHKDSTYDDQKSFGSTLYNRPFDQLFVLNEIDRLSKAGSGSFLSGAVDASRTGIIGYSMGGYGVINVIGGGYSAASATFSSAPPNRMLAERGAANPDYQKARDSRIKAAIAIGPWGMQSGFWDADGLKGIRTPVMVVAGSVDDVSGYDKGPRALFELAVNADRYLLTFINANHNAAAPMSAPAEVLAAPPSTLNPASHYLDAVWDNTRMNNIFDHFATAFLGLHLKGDVDMRAYLDVVPNGKDAVYSVDRDGKPNATHTYWKGFKRATAVGLILEHRAAGR
jgi:predicted dienelactone hydrolase